MSKIAKLVMQNWDCMEIQKRCIPMQSPQILNLPQGKKMHTQLSSDQKLAELNKFLEEILWYTELKALEKRVSLGDDHSQKKEKEQLTQHMIAELEKECLKITYWIIHDMKLVLQGTM